MLVAYGVRQDGTRHLLAVLRSRGESQADWEGLLTDLYRRGFEGKKLLLIVTDGCAGLAAAIQTVYPRVGPFFHRCRGKAARPASHSTLEWKNRTLNLFTQAA